MSSVRPYRDGRLAGPVGCGPLVACRHVDRAAVLIGAHVSAGGGLVPALDRGAAIGAEVVQIFTQSPRAWKPYQYAPEVLAAYRDAQAAQDVVRATFCHATYLINLATPDRALADRSRACLIANLGVASGVGAAGLILHVGSHRGTGLDAALPGVVAGLAEALASVDDDRSCPILLENAAGAGDTVGRSFDELAEIIDATGGHDRLGVCLDTQHLWASGVDYSTVDRADAVLADLDRAVGLDRLACIHLNDSAVPFGANRDRHANLGEGTIGESGLAALLGHPALDGVPAILEVPGRGDGPAGSDVDQARRILAEGRALRA